MKKKYTVVILLLLVIQCWGQEHKRKVFKVFLVQGSEKNIINAGKVAAQFNFDSIGKQRDIKTEDAYVQFNISNESNTENGKPNWLKSYNKEKAILNKKFNKRSKGRLKNQSLTISTAFKNTPLKLIIYFIKDIENINGSAYCAVYQFINATSGTVVAHYYIEPILTDHPYSESYSASDILVADDHTVCTMTDLCLAMANYFKNNLLH